VDGPRGAGLGALGVTEGGPPRGAFRAHVASSRGAHFALAAAVPWLAQVEQLLSSAVRGPGHGLTRAPTLPGDGPSAPAIQIMPQSRLQMVFHVDAALGEMGSRLDDLALGTDISAVLLSHLDPAAAQSLLATSWAWRVQSYRVRELVFCPPVGWSAGHFGDAAFKRRLSLRRVEERLVLRQLSLVTTAAGPVALRPHRPDRPTKRAASLHGDRAAVHAPLVRLLRRGDGGAEARSMRVLQGRPVLHVRRWWLGVQRLREALLRHVWLGQRLGVRFACHVSRVRR
jgi:hypothetical protein